jgi:hypothetical protein
MDLNYKVAFKRGYLCPYFVYHRYYSNFWWFWAVFSSHCYQWKYIINCSSLEEVESIIKHDVVDQTTLKNDATIRKQAKFPRYFSSVSETDIKKVELRREYYDE